MNDIIRKWPRFTFMVGFDLNRPRVWVGRMHQGHYSAVLGFIEFHLLIGKARDLQIDVLDAGITALTAAPPDPHTCPRCHERVGATGWHIAAREHDSCPGRIEPLHTQIEKGTI